MNLIRKSDKKIITTYGIDTNFCESGFTSVLLYEDNEWVWSFITKFVPDTINERAKLGFWINKDGNRFQIVDMSKQHIRNCMNLLESQEEYVEVWNIFSDELTNKEIKENQNESIHKK